MASNKCMNCKWCNWLNGWHCAKKHWEFGLWSGCCEEFELEKDRISI